MIFEKEVEGLAGEPARARIFLKVGTVSLVLALILLNASNWILLKIFSSFFVLGAMYGFARGLFHLVTVGITRLDGTVRVVAQIVVALLAALLPFLYLAYSAEPLPELLAYVKPSGWSVWLSSAVVGYFCYVAGDMSRRSMLPVRSYLIAVVSIFFLVLIGAYGGFNVDDGTGSRNVQAIDPSKLEGRSRMAANYLWMIMAAYVGLSIGVVKGQASLFNRSPT
ncbi:MAG TPA: hypothetical protein VJ746_06690 [Nitrospira sp.]|nr:hypothetical protein [Nitrospira sp.]